MRSSVVAAILLVGTTVSGQQTEISVTSTAGVNRVKLDWEAIPGKTYSVHSTSNLTSDAWSSITPSGVAIPNVLGSFTTATISRAQFFQVHKEDTDGPTVTNLLPGADAIVVVSNATVSIFLYDETGIDTNSIRLSIAGWANMTLGGGGLSYSNGTVAFRPPGVLGQPGTVVSNALTVSDTLGHTLSNYTWTFQLARQIVATNTFVPLSAPQGLKMWTLSDGTTRMRSLSGVQPLGSADEYHIVSVTSNTVVFSYVGTPPAITNGSLLVSFDAAYPFYRSVVSNILNQPQQQITAWTTDIPLTGLMSQGSVSSIAFVPAQTNQGIQALFGGSQNLLHVEFGDDLSGRVLAEGPGLKLWLPTASWGFMGDVDVALDVFQGKLRSLDATATGRLTLNAKPEVIFYQAISGGDQVPLIEPRTKIFGAMAGGIPVWVEVTMELNAGYEYSANVPGAVHTTIDAEKDLTFRLCLRDDTWTYGLENPPIVLSADPITWQIEGTANAKVYIQPKLTVLVYSLAGLWADLVPYVEFDGNYQVDPLKYELALYFGLSSTVGIESRIWYDSWGAKPEWTLFDQKWPLWSTSYPTNVAPVFVSSFPNWTVMEGSRIMLSGFASGTPRPSYEWYFNGSRIVGANGPDYDIASAQLGHQGTYAVLAQNSAGSVQTSCYITVVRGDYLVIDLSGGPSASSYPVSYLSAVPLGGWTDEYKTTKLVLRRIQAGAFTEGSPTNEVGRADDETQHQVTLTQSFYIGVFEVTQKQWERVMGDWPSYFNNATYRDTRPVERVSYSAIRGGDVGTGWPVDSDVDADSFIGRLRTRSVRTFDLPTEAQWEYAGRAGTSSALNSGKNLTSTASCPNVSEVGRYLYNGGSGDAQNGDTSLGTAKVGSYLPNSRGLYDFHGNVWEWCLDRYGIYPGAVTDPKGDPPGGFFDGRVDRGGSWGNDAQDCRTAHRNYDDANNANRSIGFRVVLPLSQ